MMMTNITMAVRTLATALAMLGMVMTKELMTIPVMTLALSPLRSVSIGRLIVAAKGNAVKKLSGSTVAEKGATLAAAGDNITT